jgi:hypothetical protein
MRDSEVAKCLSCHRSFTFLSRKHHCRKCGKIFCDQCSSKTFFHASEHMRVCDGCYLVLNSSASLSPSSSSSSSSAPKPNPPQISSQSSSSSSSSPPLAHPQELPEFRIEDEQHPSLKVNQDILFDDFFGGGDHAGGSASGLSSSGMVMMDYGFLSPHGEEDEMTRSDSFMEDCPKCGMTFRYMRGNPTQIENHLNECFSQSLTQSSFVQRRRFMCK